MDDNDLAWSNRSDGISDSRITRIGDPPHAQPYSDAIVSTTGTSSIAAICNHNTLIPMGRLPPEILSWIFVLHAQLVHWELGQIIITGSMPALGADPDPPISNPIKFQHCPPQPTLQGSGSPAPSGSLRAGTR
ncbi:hypothetical protein BD779DRAFT_1473134 [Infundibulicybe gibba]|nr:hypothetical protein BD779DRAFT_1473134 [Infundibulicybe gibba]